MSQESILGPYLKPGTPIKVGNYSTKIIRYLSEGGFSHVYTAKLDIPVKGSDVAVLKRIVAPDKHALAAIRTEVETMKKLKGHRYIVTYIDSHASALATGGFEVYVLMEYCPGGGLIDFMNTRLQTRLAEWEVLKIISDTTEAVACMHYLRPPLLHRDLKIENVLISGNGDYKLCDFGSCTEPRPPATNSQERRSLEDDIQKNTTIQYRSPEMVDVSRRLPIDEKSDIWALGVLLYKLCYFTTPFETQGQLAILNAAYTFPPYPPYTDRTKRLIAVTLQENPRDRPNIYQLLAEICAMRNVPVPIPDIYSKPRSSSQNARSRPSSRPPTAHNEDILTYEAAAAAAPKTPVMEATAREPMRRGRPERTTSPVRQDSFQFIQKANETLSSSSQARPAVDEEEFTTKFPSLEEMDFSLDKDSSRPMETSSNAVISNSRRSFDVPKEPSDPRSLNRAAQEEQTTHANKLQSESYVNTQTTRPLSVPPVAMQRPDSAVEDSERTMRPSEIGKSGNYIRQSSSPPRPEPQIELKNTDHQRNDDVSIPSTGPSIIRPKPIHMERAEIKETGSKQNSNPYNAMNDRLRLRPQMVSRSSQTSPKPQQAMQTQTSPIKPRDNPLLKNSSSVGLSDNLMRDSSGYIVKKPGARNENYALPPKPQFKFSTSIDRPNSQMRLHEQAQQTNLSNAVRPQTVHIVPTAGYHKGLDNIERGRLSEPLEDNRTGTSLDSDAGKRPVARVPPSAQDQSVISTNVRRSVSVSASTHRHGKRPSLTNIPSFSGAAKNIMNGKFSDAFKKFETSGRPKGTTPAIERSNPLQVAENDLPDHVTQHLQNAEARRSSSYSRNRPSFDALSRPEHVVPILEKSSSVESTSTSVKDAMRRLKEKANQTYVPQRSAQGYGKYTDVEGPIRAATVVPYARDDEEERRPVALVSQPISKHNKNPRRYGLTEDDDDASKFSQRYPSLSDFKV